MAHAVAAWQAGAKPADKIAAIESLKREGRSSALAGALAAAPAGL